MPDANNNLYLYEALEIRRECDTRINTLNTLLPEEIYGLKTQYSSYSSQRYFPTPDLKISEILEKIQALEVKKRKLNSAIQKVNLHLKINVNNEALTLSDALFLRKATENKIEQLKKSLKIAAYGRVIYKEDRNIEELPMISFKKIKEELEYKLSLFHELNTKIRSVSYDAIVDFKNEC